MCRGAPPARRRRASTYARPPARKHALPCTSVGLTPDPFPYRPRMLQHRRPVRLCHQGSSVGGWEGPAGAGASRPACPTCPPARPPSLRLPQMPLLHRLSVFRDDLIFAIFLYQRWIYRVDRSRTNEFGCAGVVCGGGAGGALRGCRPMLRAGRRGAWGACAHSVGWSEVKGCLRAAALRPGQARGPALPAGSAGKAVQHATHLTPALARRCPPARPPRSYAEEEPGDDDGEEEGEEGEAAKDGAAAAAQEGVAAAKERAAAAGAALRQRAAAAVAAPIEEADEEEEEEEEEEEPEEKKEK